MSDSIYFDWYLTITKLFSIICVYVIEWQLLLVTCTCKDGNSMDVNLCASKIIIAFKYCLCGAVFKRVNDGLMGEFGLFWVSVRQMFALTSDYCLSDRPEFKLSLTLRELLLLLLSLLFLIVIFLIHRILWPFVMCVSIFLKLSKKCWRQICIASIN